MLRGSIDVKASTLHGLSFLIAFLAVLLGVYLLGKVLEKAVDLVALGLGGHCGYRNLVPTSDCRLQ